MSSTQTLGGGARPNQAATGNGAVASRFHVAHHRRAVPELPRSAEEANLMKRFALILLVPTVLVTSGCGQRTTYERVTAQPPVREMGIAQINNDRILVVRLLEGVHMTNVLDVSSFQGLKPSLTFTEASARIGQPIRTRPHPDLQRMPLNMYRVGTGELGLFTPAVSLSSGPSPSFWRVFAFPTNTSPQLVILDSSVRTQVVQRIAQEHYAGVSIEEDTYGTVTLKMTTNKVDYISFFGKPAK